MTTSGSLFGNAGSTPASGGLFGSNTTTTNTTNSGGGLFGSSTPTTNPTGGGLFGNTNTNISTPTNTNTGGSGLFGTSNTTSTSTSLFGASSTAPSTGLFGSTTNTANQNKPQSGGLFGTGTGTTTGAGTTGGGLFGSSTTSTALANSGGGLFGSSTTANAGGGLFGNTNTSTGLFGSSNTNTTNTGFGTGNQNTFMNQQAGGVSNAQAASLSLAPWWFRELDSISAAYEPFGQRNKFQTILYEVIGVAPDLLCVSGAVAPTHIEYVKKQRKNEIFQRLPWLDQREWQLAEQRNPDPSNLMPTPIIGIDALHERVGQQMSHVRTQLQMLATNDTQPTTQTQGQPSRQNQNAQQNQAGGASLALVTSGLQNGSTNGKEAKAEQSTSWLGLDASDMFDEKIEYCRHEHVRLMHRLIKVMGRLERLQCVGTPRTKEEVAFDDRLNKLRKKLEDPQGCKAMISELGAQLQLEEVPRGNSRQKKSEGLGLQAKEEEALFKFLEFQRDGLEHLMKIVKKDMRDLHIIQARLAPHINK